MYIRHFIPVLFFFSIIAFADTDPSQSAFPGQIVKYQTRDGVLLADGDVDWSRYTRVQLERGTVKFREDWVQDQRQIIDNSIIREADLERIKTDMSDLLEKVLTRKLSDKDGYTLSAESGADVLRFTPRIEKLDIYAPDRARNYIGHVLTDSQGSMVLVMDISDSVSGELLASAVQKQVDQESGYLESTSSGTNRRAFRQMMERWAIWFLELFDEVRAGTLH
jgi:hypothetical protein